MMNRSAQFLSTDGFMPHGMCYLWQPGVLGLHVISDSLITLAYFSIPFTLVYFARKRTDLKFNWMLVCFAVFIVACGTTHLMEIWTIWHATYWLSGGIKALTALASVPTAILLIKLLPNALRLPSPSALNDANIELAREVAERKRAEDEVRRTNEHLEARVAERTAEVQAVNRRLIHEARERQRAEETVRSSEHLLQEIIDNSLAVIYVKDTDGRYLLVNRRFEDIFHRTRASTLGRTDYEFFSKQVADAFRAMDQRVIAAGQALTEEETVPQSDGTHTYVSVKCPLRDGARKTYGVFGVSTDITDRKRMEEALRESEERQAELYGALQHAYEDLRQTQQSFVQQERLGALGQMASGIAHDINNAISPISLYTESLLEDEPALSQRARSYLTTIQHAVSDVAATVARMREFYRQRGPQLELARVRVNQILSQVIDLTRARWSDMPQQRGVVIDLRMECPADVPDVMGAESEIRDALINLIFNAVDAMPEGGALTLRARRIVVAPPIRDRPEVAQACIEVTDTGIGMNEETRRRCLEPFFTTKGERGTGLGLAMVYGMAQRHAADLEIESEPGRGTTIRLRLPAQTDPHTLNTPDAEPGVPRRLRILLIDDDPLLIKALRDTLETDGHTIVLADGGQAGIAAFTAAAATGQFFDIVITDLGMPYVDGRKVAAAIKALAARMPVVMLTGWGHGLLAAGDVPPHVDRVLSKPPRLSELRATLAELTATATC